MEARRRLKRTSRSRGLAGTADGVGAVTHAGTVATRLLADRTGLTGALSKAMTRHGRTWSRTGAEFLSTYRWCSPRVVRRSLADTTAGQLRCRAAVLRMLL